MKNENVARKMYNTDRTKFKRVARTLLFELEAGKSLVFFTDGKGKIVYEKLYTTPKDITGKRKQGEQILRLLKSKAMKNKGANKSYIIHYNQSKEWNKPDIDVYFKGKGIEELYEDYRYLAGSGNIRVKKESKMAYTDDLNEAVKIYREKKVTENRNKLADLIWKHLEEAKYKAKEGKWGYVMNIFRSNMVLPFTHRVTMYPLFTTWEGSDKEMIPSDVMANRNVWDLLPKECVKKVVQAKVNYQLNPKNKGLKKILHPIAGKDDLRPVMTGMSFDETGVTVTDAHKLIHVSGKRDGRYKEGVYHTKDEYEIQEKYPNWQGIFTHDTHNIVSVNLQLLSSVAKTLLDNRLLYPVTNAVRVRIPNKDFETGYFEFGVNAKFLIEIATALMQLGIQNADMYYLLPNRPIIFVSQGATVDDSVRNLANHTFGLVMPVMLNYNNMDEPSNIEIVGNEAVKTWVGQTTPKTITYSELFGSSAPELVEKEEVLTTEQEIDYIKELIIDYEFMLEDAESRKEKRYYEGLIEDYKMLLEDLQDDLPF
jgi:hypothetical protein